MLKVEDHRTGTVIGYDQLFGVVHHPNDGGGDAYLIKGVYDLARTTCIASDRETTALVGKKPLLEINILRTGYLAQIYPAALTAGLQKHSQSTYTARIADVLS